MKYPYIARNESSVEMLVFSESKAIILSEINKGILHDVHPAFSRNYKNITREYLANTYGKVESKEHAEFIVDLCKVNGVDFLDDYKGGVMWFNCKCGLLDFYIDKNTASNDGEKLITIPLPPKQIQTATSEEEFEMQQIMKNNGDNLVLGCEDSKCEWPQIGDLVQANFGKGIVKSLADKNGILSVMTDRGFNLLANMSDIKKPKTPAEELRDDLIELYCTAGYETEKYIDLLMSKYNITKKPQ